MEVGLRVILGMLAMLVNALMQCAISSLVNTRLVGQGSGTDRNLNVLKVRNRYSFLQELGDFAWRCLFGQSRAKQLHSFARIGGASSLGLLHLVQFPLACVGLAIRKAAIPTGVCERPPCPPGYPINCAHCTSWSSIAAQNANIGPRPQRKYWK